MTDDHDPTEELGSTETQQGSSAPPARIGHYRILQKIGEGVWARPTWPSRARLVARGSEWKSSWRVSHASLGTVAMLLMFDIAIFSVLVKKLVEFEKPIPPTRQSD